MGSEVKYHSGNEDIAEAKNIQSVLVIAISPRFKKANTAIEMVRIPETPIDQEPTPAPSLSCARNTINVVEPQITQEKTCGLTDLLIIEPIYGRVAVNVSTIAMMLRSSLVNMLFQTYSDSSVLR